MFEVWKQLLHMMRRRRNLFCILQLYRQPSFGRVDVSFFAMIVQFTSCNTVNVKCLTTTVHLPWLSVRQKVCIVALTVCRIYDYVCILRAKIQPTLDPYAEAFL